MKNSIYIFIVFIGFLVSCQKPNPNTTQAGRDQLKSLEVSEDIDKNDIAYESVFYVPIYSDIYLDAQNQNNLLSATLSIRNTSFNDSLYISVIDYYNTTGEKVRSYIDNTINIPPMATLNYVIEKDDDTGGPGANFIIKMNGRNPELKPIIQAVMIGNQGNKSLAFSTDAYLISE